MSKRLKKYGKLIENYNDFPSSIRKSITQNADKELTNVICEICLNIVNGKLSENKSDKSVKNKIRIITALANKKKSLAKKVKYIRQKGGFILPLLSSLIGPIIVSLLNNTKE